MTRRRWIYPPGGEPFEVTPDYVPEPTGPFIQGDLTAYESPIDGREVAGRAQRREDLKRSGSRPWEGFEAEKREAARQRQYTEQHLAQRLEETAWRSYFELPPDKRRILRGS